MKQDDKNLITCASAADWLADYASLPYESENHLPIEMETHFKECPGCNEEYELIRRIRLESKELDTTCDEVMASIHWEENAYRIAGKIPFKSPFSQAKQPSSSWFRFFTVQGMQHFGWKIAGPLLATVFLFGIGLGYLFFHSSERPYKLITPDLPVESTQTKSLARMENTLARKEAANYFDRSQIVLSDVLKQCNTQGSFSFSDSVDMKRVRMLLNENRYFNRNLDDPQLMSSKDLVKKIDWVLFEIMMTDVDSGSSCEKIQKLKEYIEKEKLLFKIRLIQKDLNISEV